jgi:hypothetical protein
MAHCPHEFENLLFKLKKAAIVGGVFRFDGNKSTSTFHRDYVEVTLVTILSNEVMRALNRGHVCEFNPDRKDRQWGKRKAEAGSMNPLARAHRLTNAGVRDVFEPTAADSA